MSPLLRALKWLPARPRLWVLLVCYRLLMTWRVAVLGRRMVCLGCTRRATGADEVAWHQRHCQSPHLVLFWTEEPGDGGAA